MTKIKAVKRIPKAKPITPELALKKKATTLPKDVIEVFNDLIAARCKSEGSFTIYQHEVEAALKNRGHEIDYDSDLEIEDAYEQSGWYVTYEKPAYNESGKAFWEFSILGR